MAEGAGCQWAKESPAWCIILAGSKGLPLQSTASQVVKSLVQNRAQPGYRKQPACYSGQSPRNTGIHFFLHTDSAAKFAGMLHEAHGEHKGPEKKCLSLCILHMMQDWLAGEHPGHRPGCRFSQTLLWDREQSL